MVLLPVGFAVPACYQARGALLPHHFTLAVLLEAVLGGIFLLHFPSARAAQALPGTVPCGARTFLGIDGADDATVRPTPPERILHRAWSGPVCSTTPRDRRDRDRDEQQKHHA